MTWHDLTLLKAYAVPATTLIAYCAFVTQALKLLLILPLARGRRWTNEAQNMLTALVALLIAYILVYGNVLVDASTWDPRYFWAIIPGAISIWLGATGGYHFYGVAKTTVQARLQRHARSSSAHAAQQQQAHPAPALAPAAIPAPPAVPTATGDAASTVSASPVEVNAEAAPAEIGT